MSGWSVALLILLVVPVVLLWIYAMIDLLRRTDQATWRKVTWIAAIVLLPIVGPLLYLIFRPSRRGDIRGFGERNGDGGRAERLLNGEVTDESPSSDQS
jgi:cytochrome bd-type quinol oxidase subunit 2